MSNLFRFSVVMPCLTDEKTLRRAFRALKAQTLPCSEIEVIVVDDASRRPLFPVCSEFEASFGRLLCIRNEKNSGRAVTRNRGLAAAIGEIVVFMDVDQVPEAGLLEALDREFQNLEVGSVRANERVHPEVMRRSAFLRYYDSRLPGARLTRDFAAKDLQDLPPKYFATGCIGVRRSYLEQVGGFDEDFRCYGCEDEELGIRLWRSGINLAFCPAALSYTVDADLTVRRASRRMVEFSRDSMPLLLLKHPGAATGRALSFLEVDPGALNPVKRFLRKAILGLYQPFIARTLLKGLERVDHLRFDCPSVLYKFTLVGFYLIGFRARESTHIEWSRCASHPSGTFLPPTSA